MNMSRVGKNFAQVFRSRCGQIVIKDFESESLNLLFADGSKNKVSVKLNTSNCLI